jgi:hypothetical protein
MLGPVLGLAARQARAVGAKDGWSNRKLIGAVAPGKMLPLDNQVPKRQPR